jgi:hypothetical protein
MKTDCIKSVGCNTYEGLDGLNNIRSSKTRNDKEDGGLLRFNKAQALVAITAYLFFI